MPIRPENKSRYSADWPQISERETPEKCFDVCASLNGSCSCRTRGETFACDSIAILVENGDDAETERSRMTEGRE